jgi:glutathione S-transferase
MGSLLGLPLTGIATVLMLLTYFWTSMVAVKARKTFNVPAPATDGPDGFKRAYRAHENTLEQLVMTLPSVWLFAVWVSDTWAALAGLVWCIGRVVYVRSYAADSDKRGTGFLIGFVATAVCLFGSLGAIIRQLVA